MNHQPHLEELLYEEEGTTLDFKREQYNFINGNDHQKSELLKDILAFANAWRRSDAYIIIGVEEVKGGRSRPLGIEIELDDAQLQQFINSKTQKPIDFNYQTHLINEIKIGVIEIPIQSRPFYLQKDYGKLKKHTVYIRRGSSTDEATPEEVFNMGKSDTKNNQETPKMEFMFADIKERAALSTSTNVNSIFLKTTELKNIPDYQENNYLGIRNHLIQVRKDYYRELVKYYHVFIKSEKLSFCIKNNSEFTVSDITAEITIHKQENNFTFFRESDLPDLPKKHYSLLKPFDTSSLIEKIPKNTIKIQDLNDKFIINVNFKKVQPRQTVFSDEWIFLSSNNSYEFTGNVAIYADNIPYPLQTSLTVQSVITYKSMDLEAIESMHDKYVIQRTQRLL